MEIQFSNKKWYIDGVFFAIIQTDSKTVNGLVYDKKSTLLSRYSLEDILDNIWEHYHIVKDFDMHYEYTMGIDNFYLKDYQ
jgi:hypothetical protein